MKVQIYKQTLKRVPRKALAEAVRQTLLFVKRRKLLGRDGSADLFKTRAINLVFVNTAEIKRLNKKFRGKNKPTDVLSFSPTEEDSLGDLVLCPAVIEEQAGRFNHTYDQELVFMVVHGILHLLGWDHERSAKEEKAMFALQEEIYQKVRR